jgi:hypothetical protein
MTVRPIEILNHTLARAEDSLARLDERLAKSPIRAGFVARTHFTDAAAGSTVSWSTSTTSCSTTPTWTSAPRPMS